MQRLSSSPSGGSYTSDTFSSNNSGSSGLNCSSSPKSVSTCDQSDGPDIYTFAAARAAAASMPKILENGRKVFGPPANWKGPRPSYLCEIFVTKVPENLDEVCFLIWLHRFGTVYEFRLMMDSGNSNRGYAFVRYSKLSEAMAAFEVLGYHFEGGMRMGVFRSQGKNRLYINNIPKALPVGAIKEGFKKIFPKLQDIMSYDMKNVNGEQNRGYAFIQFYNHEEALEAKKRTTPGRVRMWNSDLKVQWAKPKHESTMWGNTSSDMNCNRQMHANRRSVNDYNAKLRLLCLANDWCIPIVVYGKNFHYYGIQYGGILLKSGFTGESCYILMEVAVANVFDIHLLMSEVAVLLIEREVGFPKMNLLLRVQQQQADIVTTFTSFSNLDTFRKTDYYFHSTDAISQLAMVMEMLAGYKSQDVLQRYKRSLLSTNKRPYLVFEEQKFNNICGILPKFRHNSPLNYNLNDTEINLMLKDIDFNIAYNNGGYKLNSLNEHSRQAPLRHMSDRNILRLRSQRPYLQDNNYILRYVDAEKGGVSFYHPKQKMNTHPIWISGRSYQDALYEYN